jgi:hypothetical protein
MRVKRINPPKESKDVVIKNNDTSIQDTANDFGKPRTCHLRDIHSYVVCVVL